MRKILIVRPDGIGDFIIFSAVLEDYEKLFKEYKIDLLCHPKVRELVREIPFINKIICINSRKLFRKRYFIYTIVSILKLLAFRYDKIIYPVYSRTKNGDSLVSIIRAKEKIAFDGNSSNDHGNDRVRRNKYFTRIIESEKQEILEIKRNVEFINKLGANIDITTVKPRIWLSDEDNIEFHRLREKFNLRENEYIVIFPGAGYQIRYWEDKKWAQLIRGILGKKLRYKVVILGYGNDIFQITAILNALDSNCRERIINLYKKTTLRILSKVIESAKLFIGTESGPIHIAAAVDTPNVCLMGGGHFGRFYPYGNLDNNRIVYKTMDCYGCNWKCKYEYPKCLSEISISDVLNQVEGLLKL